MNSEERLAQIEARLEGLERFIKLNLSQQAAPARDFAPAPPPPQASPAHGPSIQPTRIPAKPFAAQAAVAQKDTSHVTNILGWAGATALVLASIYLVVLAIARAG